MCCGLDNCATVTPPPCGEEDVTFWILQVMFNYDYFTFPFIYSYFDNCNNSSNLIYYCWHICRYLAIMRRSSIRFLSAMWNQWLSSLHVNLECVSFCGCVFNKVQVNWMLPPVSPSCLPHQMNDIMLYTYPQQDGKYRLKNTLSLSGMKVIWLFVSSTISVHVQLLSTRWFLTDLS